jgi:hypothetical protein
MAIYEVLEMSMGKVYLPLEESCRLPSIVGLENMLALRFLSVHQILLIFSIYEMLFHDFWLSTVEALLSIKSTTGCSRGTNELIIIEPKGSWIRSNSQLTWYVLQIVSASSWQELDPWVLTSMIWP